MLTKHGLHPGLERVSAVQDMQPPCDKVTVGTVLGMINYLANFAHDLTEITSLLLKNREFRLSRLLFNNLKDLTTKIPGLPTSIIHVIHKFYKYEMTSEYHWKILLILIST